MRTETRDLLAVVVLRLDNRCGDYLGTFQTIKSISYLDVYSKASAASVERIPTQRSLMVCLLRIRLN